MIIPKKTLLMPQETVELDVCGGAYQFKLDEYTQWGGFSQYFSDCDVCDKDEDLDKCGKCLKANYKAFNCDALNEFVATDSTEMITIL